MRLYLCIACEWADGLSCCGPSSEQGSLQLLCQSQDSSNWTFYTQYHPWFQSEPCFPFQLQQLCRNTGRDRGIWVFGCEAVTWIKTVLWIRWLSVVPVCPEDIVPHGDSNNGDVVIFTDLDVLIMFRSQDWEENAKNISFISVQAKNPSLNTSCDG